MNILLTSVGRRSYLVEYFKEALRGEGKVHVSNSTEITPAFKNADASIVSPLIYDEQYIPFLLNYCKKNSINAIISLFDVDLMILSKNKKRFEEEGITVVVSNENVIEICNDKWNTYQFLKENNFKTPLTFLSLDTAIEAVISNELSFPLIIKPRWGMGSIAIYEADNIEELRLFYSKVKKNIMKTYLKYESEEDVNNCVLIQEKLSGQEFGLDIINNLQGEYKNTVVKKKFAMRSGETDCAVTVSNPEIKALGKALSKKLMHIGNLDVDIFYTNNMPYILEMNARFGGGYPFSHIAGVNLPKAIILWLNNTACPESLLLEQIGIIAHKDIKIISI